MSTATTPDTGRQPGDADRVKAASGASRGHWWRRRRRVRPNRRVRNAWTRERGTSGRRATAARTGRRATAPRTSRRRWPWIVALALVVVLLCGAVYTVFFSPLLAVRSVAITGATDDLTAKVRAAVHVQDQTPLARVDLDQVAAEVKSVAEVAQVEVARGWPDSVAITVTPRVPVAVTSANGQLWLLDSAGDPYLSVASPPPGLVTVQLVTPGEHDPSTTAALTVVAVLTPDFRSQVAVLSARTPFDVELLLTDRRKVIWGEASQSAEKMQVLPALLAARDGTEYDISDPTLVTVR